MLCRLGQTDMEVTPVGLGCWQFSAGRGLAGKFWETLPQSSVDQVVATSLDGGINWFDTAEIYGNGASERALAVALVRAGKAPGDVVIATKWMPLFRTAHSIKSTIRQRIEHLAPFPIDLHQVHNPFSFSSVEDEMKAMADLVSERKIRAVGVSNFGASRMQRAHAELVRRGLVLASNQVKYSLLDRRVESKGTIAAARELGVTIIAYSPLEQGLLTGKYHQDTAYVKSRPGPRKWMARFRSAGLERSRPVIEELGRIAASHGATCGQVALAWLFQFNTNVVVIPGASRAEQARENCGALNLKLSARELQRLDELSAPFK
ncbi:MAG: aldo/keto reductase [Acidobacteria bacterium]|nr:aldo/keto reductase [Acidobacteriota bacterium]